MAKSIKFPGKTSKTARNRRQRQRAAHADPHNESRGRRRARHPVESPPNDSTYVPGSAHQEGVSLLDTPCNRSYHWGFRPSGSAWPVRRRPKKPTDELVEETLYRRRLLRGDD